MSLANPAASWGFANDDLHFMVKSRPIRQDSIMICLKTRFPVTQKRPVIMFPIIIAIKGFQKSHFPKKMGFSSINH
jgi:hypothetical protein